ncbi:unnamed protein product, partial [Ostreobium quekettii]
YVPSGISLASNVDLNPMLPSALSESRIGGGLSAVAVSPNGTRALALMGKPLGDPAGGQKDSHSVLALDLNVENLDDVRVNGVYVYMFENTELGAWQESKTGPADVVVSSAQWASARLGSGHENSTAPVLLVMERNTYNQMKIFLVDFSNATDISADLEASPLKFDSLGTYRQTDKYYRAENITPALKVLVLDSADESLDPTGQPPVGAVALSSCVLATAGDNSHGLNGMGAVSINVAQLPRCLDTVYNDSVVNREVEVVGDVVVKYGLTGEAATSLDLNGIRRAVAEAFDIDAYNVEVNITYGMMGTMNLDVDVPAAALSRILGLAFGSKFGIDPAMFEIRQAPARRLRLRKALQDANSTVDFGVDGITDSSILTTMQSGLDAFLETGLEGELATVESDLGESDRAFLGTVAGATISASNTEVNATVETVVTVSANSAEALSARAESFSSDEGLQSLKDAYTDQGFEAIR